ncbi:hypothetical protein [Sorangium cellulosum]|nr:hypothetical protein [Sorangium cellulosum]
MTKFQELNKLIEDSHAARQLQQSKEIEVLSALINGFGRFMECPEGRYVRLPMKADKDIGESAVSQYAIRDKKWRIVGAFKLALDDLILEINMYVRKTDAGFEAACFGATAVIDPDNSHTSVAFYESILVKLKEHVRKRILGQAAVDAASGDDTRSDVVSAA